MTIRARTKFCARCGKAFVESKSDSHVQWHERQFCSVKCSTKGRIYKSIEDRLLDKIDIIPESGCWIWMGSLDGQGYGQLSSILSESPVKAHRVSYELFVDKIPDDLLIRHKCDIPCCINPNHLEVGTQKDNIHDAVMRGRLNPLSLLNLHPGEKGIYGAGTKSRKELQNHVNK